MHKPTEDHCAFQRAGNPTECRAEHHDGIDLWDKEKANPKGPQLASNLHEVAGIIRCYIDKNSLLGRGVSKS
jgi:O-acetyl-ADP-ribose deacetylase (regulator of RNase III)